MIAVRRLSSGEWNELKIGLINLSYNLMFWSIIGYGVYRSYTLERVDIAYLWFAFPILVMSFIGAYISKDYENLKNKHKDSVYYFYCSINLAVNIDWDDGIFGKMLTILSMVSWGILGISAVLFITDIANSSHSGKELVFYTKMFFPIGIVMAVVHFFTMRYLESYIDKQPINLNVIKTFKNISCEKHVDKDDFFRNCENNINKKGNITKINVAISLADASKYGSLESVFSQERIDSTRKQYHEIINSN